MRFAPAKNDLNQITNQFYNYIFETTTSRIDLKRLICDFGDETSVIFNVTDDINDPKYKRYAGFSNSSTNENLNIPDNLESNRYILTNTEFKNDVLIKSIEILPNKTGFIDLWVISYQFDCNISCSNELNKLNQLTYKYKLTTNMTVELKNLSLHTFYFNSDIPLQKGT